MKTIIKVEIVTYNDCYGNGNRQLEDVIQAGTFDKWLEKHNADRDAEPEGPEEFDRDEHYVYVEI